MKLIKPFRSGWFLSLWLLFAGAAHLYAQSASTATLFGDLDVDESQVKGQLPQTYRVLLYTDSGWLIRRQAVANHGRYRFLGVPNGQYELAVELGTQEVARIRFFLLAARQGLVRRDLKLKWHPPVQAKERLKPGQARVVSAQDNYSRSAESQSRFKKALKEESHGNFARAREILDKMVALDPADFEAWTELGTCEFRLRNWSAAEDRYRKALSLYPGFLPAAVNLGKLQISRGRFPDAVQTLQEIAKIRPDSDQAHFYLGLACFKLRRFDLAEKELRRTLELAPYVRAESHLLLGNIYVSLNRTGEAVKEYRRFLELRPDYVGKKELKRYIQKHKK